MEDYKKLYEDLVDRVKTMAEAQPLVTKEAIEMHFPEIVESEDEKIRKELIAEVKEQIECIPPSDCRNKEDDKALKRLGKWLTWLENKEEDSYAHRKTQEFMKGFKRVQCYEELSEWEKMFDNIASKYANRKNDEGYNNSWFVKERAGDMLYYAKQEIERQNNQKLDAIDISEEQKDKLQEENLNAHPELLNNEVKPKFKVGDWIVNKDHSYLIADIDFNDNRYLFEIGGYTHEQLNWEYIENADNKYHLWTIQDAKDGDVLCCEKIILLFKKWEDTDWNFVIAYAGIDISGKLQITNGHWLINNNSHPATKEQRDTLFAKIKEAGYEWDAENKQLKKISQRMISAEAKEAMYDKPSWSKEDEKMLDEIIDFFDKGKFYFLKNHSMEDYAKLLQSIKLRSCWKPSEHQIASLKAAINVMNASKCYDSDLVQLLKDLEKLYEKN